MTHDRIPDPVQQMLDTELAVGETVRWAEQPAPLAFSLPVGSVLLDLFIAGFGVYWTQGAMKGPGGVVFGLFGLLPVCVGVGMVISPFLLHRRIRRAAANTAYAVTDRRAIVIGGYRPEQALLVKMGFPSFMANLVISDGSAGWVSYNPDSFDDIQRHQHADGTGDVVFKKELLGRSVHPIGFFSVHNAREAETLLNDLVEKVRAG